MNGLREERIEEVRGAGWLPSLCCCPDRTEKTSCWLRLRENTFHNYVALRYLVSELLLYYSKLSRYYDLRFVKIGHFCCKLDDIHQLILILGGEFFKRRHRFHLLFIV